MLERDGTRQFGVVETCEAEPEGFGRSGGVERETKAGQHRQAKMRGLHRPAFGAQINVPVCNCCMFQDFRD